MRSLLKCRVYFWEVFIIFPSPCISTWTDLGNETYRGLVILVPSGNILGTRLESPYNNGHTTRVHIKREFATSCHHVTMSFQAKGSTSSLGRLINTTKGHCLREGGSIKPFNSLINLQNVVWIRDTIAMCNYGYSSPPGPHPTLLFPYMVQHLYKQLLEIVISRVNWWWIPALSSRR